MKQTPYQFFKTHAGYSYDPKTQTKEQGRRECARRLVRAEATARDSGTSFAWEVDEDGDMSAGEFSSEGPFWSCVARDESGRVVGSIGGVDFGTGVEPWGQPYRRVVEAEVALEVIA